LKQNEAEVVGGGWYALTHLGFLQLVDSSSRIDILYIIGSLFRLAKFKLTMYDDSNFDQLLCIWMGPCKLT
jgi:hypothetical protein